MLFPFPKCLNLGVKRNIWSTQEAEDTISTVITCELADLNRRLANVPGRWVNLGFECYGVTPPSSSWLLAPGGWISECYGVTPPSPTVYTPEPESESAPVGGLEREMERDGRNFRVELTWDIYKPIFITAALTAQYAYIELIMDIDIHYFVIRIVFIYCYIYWIFCCYAGISFMKETPPLSPKTLASVQPMSCLLCQVFSSFPQTPETSRSSPWV